MDWILIVVGAFVYLLIGFGTMTWCIYDLRKEGKFTNDLPITALVLALIWPVSFVAALVYGFYKEVAKPILEIWTKKENV